MSNSNSPPASYTTPPFPSLYWPFGDTPSQAKYLYTLGDIFRFTLYWTLITIPAAHLVVALIATLTQFSSAHQRYQYLKQYKSGRAFVIHAASKANKDGGVDAQKRKGSESQGGEDAEKEKNQPEDVRSKSSRSDSSNNDGVRDNTSESGSSKDAGIDGKTQHEESSHARSRSSKIEKDAGKASRRGGGQGTKKFNKKEDDAVENDANGKGVENTPTQGIKVLTSRNRKLLGTHPYKDALQTSSIIVAVYVVIGTIEATIAGSLVGLVLGAVYNSGFFRMSVWTPLCWGIINMLVLILASFRISGGL